MDWYNANCSAQKAATVSMTNAEENQSAGSSEDGQKAAMEDTYSNDAAHMQKCYDMNVANMNRAAAAG